MTEKANQQRQPISVFAILHVSNCRVAIGQFLRSLCKENINVYIDSLTELENGSRPDFLESVLLCRRLCNGHIDYHIASAGVNTLLPKGSLPFKTTGQHSASQG